MKPSARATIKDLGAGGAKLEVLFNPTSLKVSLTNKLQDEEAGSSGNAKGADKNGKAAKARQTTRSTTTKLDVELVFDTTETGTDVRDGPQGTQVLKQMAAAPEPKPDSKDPPAAPPQIEFRWGRFAFKGLIESVNETLDFWSSEGVPLRSTVQIVLQGTGTDTIEKGADAKLPPATAQAVVPVPKGGRGVTDVAASHGNAGAGRAIAAANGIEDMRMGGGGAVAVSASVELQAAASFSLSASASAGAGASIGGGIGIGASAGLSAGAGAGASLGFGIGASASAGASAGIGMSAGAGFSAGAGIGISAGAGFSAGASAGFGASASAGFSASASAGASFGGSATAGVSASAGAFAGLGASKTVAVSLPVDPILLLPRPSAPAIGAGTSFDITGRAVAGGGGLNAQVSAQASAGVRIM